MEKLDSVLFYLKENKNQMIEFRELKKHFEPSIDGSDLQLIVHKLEMDGYIERESKDRIFSEPGFQEIFHDHYYRINYLGLLYEGYKKSIEAEHNRIRTQDLKDKLLIVAAWMAGIYGVFEMLKWLVLYFQENICHCRFFLEK